MLVAGSAFVGYDIEATDGRIGTVKTFLFNDRTWKISWLVVDTGGWLTGRRVLIHPSAIGRPDHGWRKLPVMLTKARIKDSPDLLDDRPVSMQMENHLYDYYGWDRCWGPNYFPLGPLAPLSPPPRAYGNEQIEGAILADESSGDPHLRSMTEITGYHLHATDGQIGHIENVLLDDADWTIRYLIVDTRDWWPGAHVLLAPFAVQEIDWSDHAVRLGVSRAQVRSSPPWDPLAEIDHGYLHGLHNHYGWSGYGW